MFIVPKNYVNGDEDITLSLRRWFADKINYDDAFRERRIEDLLEQSVICNEKEWNQYFLEKIKKGEVYRRTIEIWPDWEEIRKDHITKIHVKDVIENIRKTFEIAFILEGAIKVINEKNRLPIFVKNSLCYDSYGSGIETSRGLQVITQKLIPNPILSGKFQSIENSIEYQEKQIDLIILMRDNFEQLLNSIESTLKLLEKILKINTTIPREDLVRSQLENLQERNIRRVFNDRNEVVVEAVGIREIRNIQWKHCRKLEKVIRNKGYSIPTIFDD